MMKLGKITVTYLLIFILSYGISNAQEVELFGVARNGCIGDDPIGGVLYKVDPGTADVVALWDIGFDGISGLAFLPNGKLVGSATNDFQANDEAILIEIDVIRGNSSLIGIIGEIAQGCRRAPDLSLDPLTETLYATGTKCPAGEQYIQTINPQSGQGTLIGPYSPFGGAGNGLAISNTGEFFVTVEESDIPQLITVDSNTGSPTFIADLTLEENVRINALAFHPISGELFGSTIDLNNNENLRSSNLVKIDTATGTTTVIGQLPDCFDGIIFREVIPRDVPTLSEWGLIATAGLLGFISFIVIRRRQLIRNS